MGRKRYPDAKRLMITADCGGSNGARVRMMDDRDGQPGLVGELVQFDLPEASATCVSSACFRRSLMTGASFSFELPREGGVERFLRIELFLRARGIERDGRLAVLPLAAIPECAAAAGD